MEILQKFKQNGYYTAELYHLLAKKKISDPSSGIIPSEYCKEMQMTTQERLQTLKTIEVDNKVNTGNTSKKIELDFSPKIIIFQNYKPNDRIVTKFTVRNVSEATKCIGLVFKESSYFFIKASVHKLSRLAPGMSVTYTVTFTPHQYQDYAHKIAFHIDPDQYIVALLAIGPRPMFDFPNDITFTKTILKMENHYMLPVNNTGPVPAGFTLQIKSPFSIIPKSAYLNVKDKVYIKVIYKTMNLGDSSGTLKVVFETGEIFHIDLKGSTHLANVELEKQTIRFLETYNTMVRQIQFKILNKSDHVLTYMCMKNRNVVKDFEEKVKLLNLFYDMKDTESAKNMKLVQYDVLSSEEHERVYTRIFYDEIQSLVADETLQFQHMHFSMTPVTGKLWPNKVNEVTITFHPKEIGDMKSIVYLDIDGVYDRIPLTLVGTSLPPDLQLNLETLDMDSVYIGKTYNYEIVAMNKGHINGVVMYRDVPPLFGSKITCVPEMQCLRPGQKETFIISFCNSNQGPYFEEIDFIIRDTSVVLKLYLKGEVVYPVLRFSKPCLDFGMVSLGLPKTLELDVINESEVDVPAVVKISSDGPEVSSFTLTDYAVSGNPKPAVPQWPREFNIEPCKVLLNPESRTTLTVTLTANLVRANQTSLEMEIEKSDSPPIVVPIMYNALVPIVEPSPDIKLRVCFIDFTYTQVIRLSFLDYSGYFTIVEPEEQSTLEVEVGIKEGMVHPNTCFKLPVKITARALGEQEFTVQINLFGLSKPIGICNIWGCGVRPIVTCCPTALHWGQVKLLNKTHKVLTLLNDSPVVVNFKAALLNKDGRWHVHPQQGFIYPESETDLVLSLYLIDAATYTNKAVIQLEKVKDILVPLSATGTGTSIVVGELRDRIHLGRNFTRIPLNCKVMMENLGTRLHALEWNEHYKPPKTKSLTAAFFNLEPRGLKIAAGEKLELTVTGLSYKVATIKETWYLIGSVEGINKKELLMECEITAEFVDPKIELSSSVIDLRYDFGPYSEYYKLTDIVSIKNVSKLPLDIDLSVKPPFAIVHKKNSYKVTEEENQRCCCICYDENDINTANIVNEMGRQSNVFIDYLTMKPVEPLKKCALHFFEDINKIKMAFNFTHAVEQRLEDQEIMKLQIVFDTTKHLTLKSKVYCDVMRLKFKGHKNKDAVKLIGKINFPNMFVLSPRVDFLCVLNGSIPSKTIKIQNITPLMVCYQFQWKKCSITNVPMPDVAKKESNKVMSPVHFKTELTSNVSEINHIMHYGSIDDFHGEKVQDYEEHICEFTPEAIPEEISLYDSELEREIMRTRIVKHITPMINPYCESEFPWLRKFPQPLKHYKTNINEVFQLVPHRGLLKPNEVQYIQVIFHPKTNINVKATLDCEVLGGPTETITVTGQSSDLIYKLSTQKINFKIRSFHENATESLLLSNVTQLPFEYKTYLNEPKFENELDSTILNLVPSVKLLDPEENADIQIIMRPGVVGYFHREFLLEIGHLPHLLIEVYGWGVIPQVYFNIPRPEVTNIPPIIGYKAIPTLTPEYLEVIKEMFAAKEEPGHSNTPLTEKCLEDPELQNEWHICTPYDDYPSIMDIELAIERMLIIRFIRHKPEILAPYFTSNKMGPIPFYTTPYEIDFGVVITGSTVNCVKDVINYGPIVTKLHFAKGTHIPQWLSLKISGRLNPGETGKLEVTFSPTSEHFQELEQEVKASFSFEVPYSVCIPIKIKALCAVPYLTSNMSEVNFGSVRCGDKIILSIPLKNVGKPTCIWFVTLRLKGPGPNPMVILESSGKFEPGEGGWLSIAFKPTMEMLYEGVLIFKFHMNPRKMTIPISGQGIVPHVHIIGPNVKFPPTLPWAETTDIFFGLTNPCPFPIELIIAHSDVNWKEEEEFYQLLYKYYNKPEEMLVPAIRPGAGMPAEVITFHTDFVETIKKAVEGETAAALKAQMTSSRGHKEAKTAATKKSKSPKNGTKTPSSPKEAPTPRKFKSEAELTSDYIKYLKENNTDPLKDALKASELASTDYTMEIRQYGLILFFHGSPCDEMESLELAYALGKKLDLSVINFDLIVVEALCKSKSPAKSILVNAINESYEQARRSMQPNDVDEQQDELFHESEDEFQTMWKKIQLISVSKNAQTPRSKASDKKKKKPSTNSSVGSHTALSAMGSTTMFQMDLINELLEDYLNMPKFNHGFVVDTLTSVVVKNPPLVLTTVLKCKRSITNYHLILCHSEFSLWAQKYEENRETDMIDENVPKVYEEKEIKEIVEKLEDMDQEEFETVSPEIKNIYILHGLEKRRKKYMQKYGRISKKISEKIDKGGKGDATDRLVQLASESRKKLKKDDVKAKPTTEYVSMYTRYQDYVKNTYDALVNIANNWVVDDCDVGFPLVSFTGQVVGTPSQKKAKKKSEIQLFQQFSDISYGDRGFPLTFIICPCVPYKVALSSILAHMPLVQEPLRREESFDVLKSPYLRKEFTVLLPKVFPTIHHEEPLAWGYLDEPTIKKCECNQLTDLHLLDDSTQENVLNILSKWHCSCGKKMTSSRTSTTDFPSADLAKSSTTEESEEEFFYPVPELLRKVRTTCATGRIVLQPGDLVRCKYSFSPQVEGNFSVKRFVEVSGWPDSRDDIVVNGICDLPRLDSRPKKMFENFVRRTVEDTIYKVSYLDDQKIFEFGPIFIGKKRVYEEEYQIDLKNSSLITADVIIEFLEDTTVFEIDQTNIVLEPGARGKLTITAAPELMGTHRSILMFCVKDNPEIISITIGCSGVIPIVEILPINKHIDYGKLLLYRREDDRFIIKNDSVLPIMWKIPNASDFVEDFIIGQTTGIVLRQDNQVTPVTYIACNVGVIVQKTMIIDIYDEQGRGEPMLSSTLFLSAECYDVLVECAFEMSNEDFLNYGNVKVNSTVYREMYLLNRGKYNIYFKLKKVKNFPEPSLLKSFEVIPDCGVVPSTLKLITIEFECKPTSSMNLVNVPAYICTLLDGSKNQVVVAKFPVCITIASFYNTFTLFPLGELNFNVITVGSGVEREVILNNTSKCPFAYEILLPPEYRIEPSISSPPPAARGGKERIIKNPPLKCGNFLIMNEDNLLLPGTSRTIPIQFLASGTRKFEETIHFIVSDTCPAEAQGVPLRLVGTGAMPSLDFWNIETTFREHLTVKSLSERKVLSSSPHCIFEENAVTLHFFGVTVNSKFSAAIDLYNNGLVPCALIMRLSYQTNSDVHIFSLDKYYTHIEPLMHKVLNVIFTPKALMEYRAVLEVKLKLLDYKEESFKICLIGEGVIPRIKLLSPQIKQNSMKSNLTFPVTCLGSVSTGQIRYKNIGTVKSLVKLNIKEYHKEERPIFWLSISSPTENEQREQIDDSKQTRLIVTSNPRDIKSIVVHCDPIRKGKIACEVKLSIAENPYEVFTILCEAEAFIADVILVGLDMLSMEVDLDVLRAQGTPSSGSTTDTKKKPKSTTMDKKKSKGADLKKSKRTSLESSTSNLETSLLKYLLDFGGCELGSVKKKSVIMVNNSEKVYKFSWNEVDAQNLVVKPSTGYISPGEEKDFELLFYAGVPTAVNKELLYCYLSVISDDSLTLDLNAVTWDNRQMITLFDHNKQVSVFERCELSIDEQGGSPSDHEDLGTLTMIVLYSAMTAYTKYFTTLKEKMALKDTFIYQTRDFEFNVENIGIVPMKIIWSFHVDEEYPARIDKVVLKKRKIIEENDNEDEYEESIELEGIEQTLSENRCVEEHTSKLTLFSGSEGRNSVDTWFDRDLPFKIEPDRACLMPGDIKVFKVTFTPIEAFEFKVLLNSYMDNIDPYDQNISCKIIAKSLIPYVHLDIEESDYLTSGRRKETGIVLPQFMTVLEFNVLGWGCYKKSFNVINPTDEAYEFIFELQVAEDNPELIPMHCNMLKGYVEGGTSTEVTFTFSPTGPGVIESQWKFVIPVYNLTINLLVVGIVREPSINFTPTILIIRNSLVGFTTVNTFVLKNNENEPLNFEFKGNTLANESGKTPIVLEPRQGILKPLSTTPIKFIYTPIQDGPTSFKLYCGIKFMKKDLILCVNALSHCIKPTVTYYLIGIPHILNAEYDTNIHLDQTASTYERTIKFTIKNDGSATFFYDWLYNGSEVKKYLQVYIEPKNGHVSPGNEETCIVHFILKQVPVVAFPVTLKISDGPVYSIFLHSEIEKPLYYFSCKEYDFEKCFTNAPDNTYKKNLAFLNNDKDPIILDLNFENIPELFVDFTKVPSIEPGEQFKIPIYFKPRHVREYEFKLQFWVNSLCEEIVTIKGEGISLLFDLYEGCQKCFDLGPVKVGDNIIRSIEVMNHSKIPIDATFIFRDMYPIVEDTTNSDTTSVCLSPSVVQLADAGPSRVQMLHNYNNSKVRDQISMDIKNALSSLKVIPSKCIIKPYRKALLKIQFKPVGMISNLDVQLNMKVLSFERPLVKLSGSATGMSLCFSQTSLQFGRVRKRGCKSLKVMLLNKGDFDARFWWQPIVSDEFSLAPQKGQIAAHTNVTFTITFRPLNHNPFNKVWASCNIENYKSLDLALYATCVDTGNLKKQTMYLECPVREVSTEHVIVTNPTDEMWFVLSEVSGGPFETLREFNVEPNSTFNIPVYFKPPSMGKFEAQILYSPLGEQALYIDLEATAGHPQPNGTIEIVVAAKEVHFEDLLVYNLTEEPESYAVASECMSVIPEKFNGVYSMNHPNTIKTWGEAAATCRWEFTCYEECLMKLKVIFVSEKTMEYQYYFINATVTATPFDGTLVFECRARETLHKELSVKNPLSDDAEFYMACDHLSHPDYVMVGRKSEANVQLAYSPLVVGELETVLAVTNEVVGAYTYKVVLKCFPAKDKEVEVSAPVGSVAPLRLRVHNKADVRAEFTTTISHLCIQGEKEYILGPQEKGKFLVWFEPTDIATQKCKVSFSSPIAGEFVFKIKGIGKPPMPQGPYEVAAGGSTFIKFKNVFHETRTFKYSIDKHEFYVKTAYDQIKAKKDIKIVVYLIDKPASGWSKPPTGRLTVETFDYEPRIHWTYFLQGV